jgi:hypothetical protein
MASKFKKALHDYDMKIKGKFMSVVMANRWMRYKKKFGPCIH